MVESFWEYDGDCLVNCSGCKKETIDDFMSFCSCCNRCFCQGCIAIFIDFMNDFCIYCQEDRFCDC